MDSGIVIDEGKRREVRGAETRGFREYPFLGGIR
jgi:hypothetical protein